VRSGFQGYARVGLESLLKTNVISSSVGGLHDATHHSESWWSLLRPIWITRCRLRFFVLGCRHHLAGLIWVYIPTVYVGCIQLLLSLQLQLLMRILATFLPSQQAIWGFNHWSGSLEAVTRHVLPVLIGIDLLARVDHKSSQVATWCPFNAISNLVRIRIALPLHLLQLQQWQGTQQPDASTLRLIVQKVFRSWDLGTTLHACCLFANTFSFQIILRSTSYASFRNDNAY
jgi:hypothetical protein